jgi:predicted Zn-dependent peptidase
VLLANIIDFNFQLIKDKFSNIYDVDIYFYQLIKGGEIRAITSMPKKSMKKTKNLIIKEILSIDFSRSFFEKVKTLTEKEFLLRETNLEDLSSLALYKLADQKVLTPQEEAEIIKTIDYSSLKKLFKQTINKNNLFETEIV